MKTRLFFTVMLFLLNTFIMGCSKYNDPQQAKAHFEKLIANHLEEGSPHEHIEAFFDNHDIPYEYTNILKKYSAWPQNVGNKNWAILINVNVNKSKSLESAEVQIVYSGI